MTQCPVTVKVVSRSEILFLLNMTSLYLQRVIQLNQIDLFIKKLIKTFIKCLKIAIYESILAFIYWQYLLAISMIRSKAISSIDRT